MAAQTDVHVVGDVPMSSDVRSHVTLIHGTWARGSRWSLLERELQTHLPKPIRIEYFEWAGRNEVSSRNQAASDLAHHLSETIEGCRNAKHFVVAHSHGGNVAIDAVVLSGLGPKLTSLVTLSTPFLEVRKRTVEPSERRLWMAVIGWLSVVLSLVGPSVSMAVAHVRWTFLVLTPALCFTMALWAAYWSASDVCRLGSIAEAHFSRIPLRILRSAGDEAALGMTTIQGLAKVSSLVSRIFAAIAFKASHLMAPAIADVSLSLVKSILVLAMVVMAFGGVAIGANAIGLRVVSWIAAAPAALALVMALWLFTTAELRFLPVMIAGAFIAVVTIATSVTLIIGFLLSVITFGVQIAVGLVFLEVTVEATPPGLWPVFQLSRDGAVGGLVHSWSHSDPRAVSQIVKWLRADGSLARPTALEP